MLRRSLSELSRRPITNMNRSEGIDSKLSLDEILSIGDSHVMLTQPYHLYAERKDPAKNMARYYAMDISLDLFGQTCLTRRWGRIGSSGQRRVHHFAQEGDAVRLFLDIARLKRARGYRPVAGHPATTDPAITAML